MDRLPRVLVAGQARVSPRSKKQLTRPSARLLMLLQPRLQNPPCLLLAQGAVVEVALPEATPRTMPAGVRRVAVLAAAVASPASPLQFATRPPPVMSMLYSTMTVSRNPTSVSLEAGMFADCRQNLLPLSAPTRLTWSMADPGVRL